MTEKTTTTLETEGKNAIEDAKASLSGLPTEDVTKVRVELVREHDTEDDEGNGKVDDSPKGRQGRKRELSSFQRNTSFHTLLTYLAEEGPATSGDVADDLDMPENTIGSGLSELWHRKLADRDDTSPYTYSINQHGKCLLEEYGKVDIPWADAEEVTDGGSESEKGGTVIEVPDDDAVESYKA